MPKTPAPAPPDRRPDSVKRIGRWVPGLPRLLRCPRCELSGEHRTDADCLTAIRNQMRARVDLPPLAVSVRPPRKTSKACDDYNPELLTIRQAAAVTQMSRRTITEWVKLGKIERVFLAGGQPRIVAASLWKHT